MQFTFTPEQEEFRTALRRFLVARSPTTEVRRLMATDDGWDRAGWQAINQDMGLTAVTIPETYGGQGFGAVELGIVAEETGRALLCAPYLASVLAATAILEAGTEAQKRALLPKIASGDCIATLAWVEDSGRWDADGVTLNAIKGTLDGHKSFVLDGHTADLIVVLARSETGLSFYTVAGTATGLERRALKTMDWTRKQSRLTFKGVKAELLGTEGAAAEPFRRTMTLAAVALANEMVGGAERLREDALEYVKLRYQFGRPLASFQTMKHKHADMLVDVELAKSAAYTAAQAAADGDTELPALASLAKACASDAYMQTAVHAVQVHGGIGFTWDNDTHLWYKRAKSSEVMLGDANAHREAMLQAWGH
jgi:alkylation response protein AidB-like acyl-CoA dehydrogenase